jgi:mannitol-1-phosphate 5-dehydrogenase
MTKKDQEQDPLMIFAEPYNSLILDKNGFINPIPDVEGLAPKENMKAWVDRKSFIHNLGHAATAYYGYLYKPDKTFLYEVLAEKDVYDRVRTTMLQSADILMEEYPGEFTYKQLEDHIDDLIHRFRNRALGDTIFRVGRDLYRKLGPDDRLIGAIKMGRKLGMPVDKIVYIVVCAFYFRAADESGQMDSEDWKFVSESENGLIHILKRVCGLSERNDVEILEMACKFEEEIKRELLKTVQ